ncbi:hypothetical protein [Bradyrhizobium sp. CCBAU 53421]|uniref:hypothetical protein n=1 Tax=Bradyrhizobium sp. CCBAU 53421 TaxID=1325120 RepID=UPI00188A664B|nr:hypothetical protein [Bradyrhizobium sp. CCBAU 53421]
MLVEPPPMLPEAREHTRSQMDVLLKHELIAPYRPQASFGGYDRYAKADLDTFLANLRRYARAVVRPPKRAANIPDAARQACCSAAEVVRLILDDRIEVMRLRSVRGYMALHVNVRQLLDAVRGPETGLSVRRLARLMRTSDRVVEALIKHKHLASYTAPNPMNRCPQVLVSPAEIAKFEASFVSLHSLAKQLKRSPGRMRAELEAAKMKPAFNPAQVRARFYRRAAITAAGLSTPTSRQLWLP